MVSTTGGRAADNKARVLRGDGARVYGITGSAAARGPAN